MSEIKCKIVGIKHLRVGDVTTRYKERIWIDDENSLEGGSYQFVNKCYPHPMIRFSIVFIVDVDLEVNTIYTNGDHQFRASSVNELSTIETLFYNFDILSQEMSLLKIHSTYSEGEINPEVIKK